MPYAVQHFLVNGSTGDPALYIGMGAERGSLLFDCGDLRLLSATRMHRVRDIFLSHAHMDHFFGFDWFLRCALGKDHSFRVFGPPGILRHVEAKLAGYLWNIPMDFTLTVTACEIRGRGLHSVRHICRHGVEAIPCEPIFRSDDGLAASPYHLVTFAVLDHGTPSLAFAFHQKAGVTFDRKGLRAMGLRLGDWMKDLEIAHLCGRDGTLDCDGTQVPLRDLERHVELKWGAKIAYVSDTVFTDEVLERATALARGSDVLYCAAKFADADRDKALETRHLTAREAGEIAREAGALELVLFHASKKYQQDLAPLVEEAARIFSGKVRTAPDPSSPVDGGGG